MSEPNRHEDEHVERGYAEENSDAPLDEMEREVSKPPEERWSGDRGSESESTG
jgi:hypothetical protein